MTYIHQNIKMIKMRKASKVYQVSEIRNKIIEGKAEKILDLFPDECIDVCITSPPYWKLRKYFLPGELGDEDYIDDYIDNLVTIFEKFKRVMKKTGTLWINIGDTYLTDSSYNSCTGAGIKKSKKSCTISKNTSQGVKGSLGLIPERLVIKLTSKKIGYCLKQKIIWHKPNGLPSSARNKFADNWEYVYLFAKDNNKYYFNLEKDEENKNIRTVWSIPVSNARGVDHLAIFPEKLVYRILRASLPHGVCIKCGYPKKTFDKGTAIKKSRVL